MTFIKIYGEGVNMNNGQIVVNTCTGEEGVITNAGYNWVDVQWNNGELETNVATWKVEVI